MRLRPSAVDVVHRETFSSLPTLMSGEAANVSRMRKAKLRESGSVSTASEREMEAPLGTWQWEERG